MRLVRDIGKIIMSSVGVDETLAETMNGFICEFCSFEDPNGMVF